MLVALWEKSYTQWSWVLIFEDLMNGLRPLICFQLWISLNSWRPWTFVILYCILYFLFYTSRVLGLLHPFCAFLSNKFLFKKKTYNQRWIPLSLQDFSIILWDFFSQKEKDSHENDQDFLFKLEKRSTNLDSKNWQIIFSLFKL